MKTYRLQRVQLIDRPRAEVFQFFADARNLEILTPPWLHFQILTPGEIAMGAGAIIQYALRIHGIGVNWTTSIATWRPNEEFVDVQLRGPYVLWHHRHTFHAVGQQTEMIDEVHYALPGGILGSCLHALFVKRDLQRIFDFRQRKITEIFDRVAIPAETSGNRGAQRVAAGAER